MTLTVTSRRTTPAERAGKLPGIYRWVAWAKDGPVPSIGFGITRKGAEFAAVQRLKQREQAMATARSRTVA